MNSLNVLHLGDPCTTIRQKSNQMNVWGMRVAPVLQAKSCQSCSASEHREGQLQGSVIWQPKLCTKKKGLNSAWHWFLPHPAWNLRSKSMQTQIATAITYCSYWLDDVLSRHFSFTGPASKITVGSGKTPTVGPINMDHAMHFSHRFRHAVQKETHSFPLHMCLYSCEQAHGIFLCKYNVIGKHCATFLSLQKLG